MIWRERTVTKKLEKLGDKLVGTRPGHASEEMRGNVEIVRYLHVTCSARDYSCNGNAHFFFVGGGLQFQF